VAGGNLEAERHFQDTIKRKRTLKEVEAFLTDDESKALRDIYHNSSFIVWGAVPGPSNTRNWEAMEPGDVVLIYNSGRIRYIGEVATKTRSPHVARYFWDENTSGVTWELIYFIVNEQKVDVPIGALNPFFGYKESYHPMGFTQINQKAVDEFAINFGDLLGVLRTLEKGEQVIHAARPSKQEVREVEEKVERAPTEHDEMQWRLIHLGMLAKCDVWVPSNDQGKQWEGHQFRDNVLKEFHQSLDVPPSVKNVDVVWKFGPYSIKSAFEIEHSTSVYSGILRLSDLRAENPNSNYPLFIVADRSRRQKVFNELQRPTFSGPALRLNEVIKYLSYDDVRKIDEAQTNGSFDSSALFSAGEAVPA
jgi:hypothetical protein